MSPNELDVNASGSGKLRRRGFLLVGAVILLAALLSGGWYYAAGKLDQMVRNLGQQLAQRGTTFECSEQEVRGYPFRLGLFCNELRFDDPSRNIFIETGEVRSAAQLYRPGHVIAEIDAPMQANLPSLAPLTLDWKNFLSSTRVSTQGLERFSLAIDGLSVAANDGGFLTPLGLVGEVEAHGRQTGERADNAQIAISLSDWLIGNPEYSPAGPVDVELALQAEAIAQIVVQGGDVLAFLRQNGGKGRLEKLSIVTDGAGRLTVSGPIEISKGGLVSGVLDVDIDEPSALIDFAAQIFPPAADSLKDVDSYLSALSQMRDGKVQIRDLTIAIREGDIVVGFFTLGSIPRLF